MNTGPPGMLRQRRAGGSTLMVRSVLGGWVDDHRVAEVFQLRY